MDKEKIIEVIKIVYDGPISDGWVYIVIAIVSGVGAFLSSYLKKSAELKVVNENFSTYLKQQQILTEDVSKIKSAIEKENILYQIKMSDFNLKSLEAIEQVYSRLIEVKIFQDQFIMKRMKIMVKDSMIH